MKWQRALRQRALKQQALKQRALRWLLIVGLLAALLAACAPSMAPTMQAAEKPPGIATLEKESTSAPAAEQQAGPVQPAATPAGQPQPAPTARPAAESEGRLVELEWPSRLRMGDSDVLRLSLVPTKDGYIARTELPDHSIQTRPVIVPRPNGYTLYAIARLDGVAFDIDPRGEDERFVPEGETVSWRWTLAARKPGQQRLSVQLRLKWVPEPGVGSGVRESQAFSRAIDVQVTSFLGLSPTQAAPFGLLGLLAGSSMLLVSIAGPRGQKRRGAALAGETLQVIEPVPGVTIETPPAMVLSAEEGGLLRGLFGGYERVAIENEFLSGYSGARTFLVRPIRPDGCADAQTIVKLGPREAIRQEFENYEAFVKDRLPPVTARIQRPPAVLKETRKAKSKRAAMQYTFIAEPGRPPVSLRQALLQDPDPGLLLQLFETFGPSWWMQRRPYTFRLGLEYDRLLPPHFVLEPVEVRGRIQERTITAGTGTPDLSELVPGNQVNLEPFRQYELRADGRSYSLTGQPGGGRPALRLRWLSASLPASRIPARVTATRMTLLRGWAAAFDRFGLPDPLDALSPLLEESVAGTRSVIHGDLNMENVLSGPGSLVWLIDFAQTREGHPLFDFAHLESELIAHVLAPCAGTPRAYLELWQSGDNPLIDAIHQMAGRCLFDPARPREYRLALFMACLGALKYPNLPELARHCLYLTAADIARTIYI